MVAGLKEYLVSFGKALASKGPRNAASSRAGPFLGLCMLNCPEGLPVSLLPLVASLGTLDSPHFLHQGKLFSGQQGEMWDLLGSPHCQHQVWSNGKQIRNGSEEVPKPLPFCCVVWGQH